MLTVVAAGVLAALMPSSAEPQGEARSTVTFGGRGRLVKGLPLPHLAIGWRQRWTPAFATELDVASLGLLNAGLLRAELTVASDAGARLGLTLAASHESVAVSELEFAQGVDAGLAAVVAGSALTFRANLEAGVAEAKRGFVVCGPGGCIDATLYETSVGPRARLSSTLDVHLSDALGLAVSAALSVYAEPPYDRDRPLIPELGLALSWRP